MRTIAPYSSTKCTLADIASDAQLAFFFVAVIASDARKPRNDCFQIVHLHSNKTHESNAIHYVKIGKEH